MLLSNEPDCFFYGTLARIYFVGIAFMPVNHIAAH